MLTFLHRPLLILALALPPLGAQPTRLELGKTVEAELGAAQTHQYVVTMRAGQFARIVVSRPDFATVMKLSEPSPEGTPLELHWPGASSRPEPLSWIAKTAGDFQMELKPAGQAAAGKYSITLHELRDTIADDSKHLEVQQLFESARGLSGKKQYAEAITEWERVLPLVRLLGLREREAVALNSLGNNYVDLAQNEKAVLFYGQAVEVYRELKDIRSVAYALRAMGRSSTNLGQNEKARGYHEQSLAAYREAKDTFNEAYALLILGNALKSLGQPEKAVDYYLQVVKLHRESKDLAREAGILTMIGFAYALVNKYEAIGYHEQALAIQRELKDRGREGFALRALAASYLGLGKYENAISYLEQALAIFRDLKDKRQEAEALSGLGGAFIVFGQPQKAIGYSEQALVIARDSNDKSWQSVALNSLARAYLVMSQYEKAIDCFNST